MGTKTNSVDPHVVILYKMCLEWDKWKELFHWTNVTAYPRGKKDVIGRNTKYLIEKYNPHLERDKTNE